MPRPFLIGAGALVVFSIALAAGGRLMRGDGPARPAALALDGSVTRAVDTRALRFVDALNGGVLVYDAASDRVIDSVAPGSGGFVRGSMRGLAGERRRRGIGPEVPFTLTRWSDGRLTLEDAATGVHLNLDAFGATNRAAFEVFLPGRRGPAGAPMP